MGKKKRARRGGRTPGVNKRAEIQKYAQDHPTATTKDIVAGLAAERGLSVTEAYVNNVKSKSKLGRKRRGGRKAGRARAAQASNGMVAVENLVAASKFADSVGGVDHARQLLDAVKKIK